MAAAQKTPAQILNERCAKVGIPGPTYEYQQLQILPVTNFRATCYLKLGEVPYAAQGNGQKKKDAQQNAASNLFSENLKIDINDQSAFDAFVTPVTTQEVSRWIEAINSTLDADKTEGSVGASAAEDALWPQASIGNPIAMLEEYCRSQRISAPISYNLDHAQVGPPHCPIVTVSCSIGSLMLLGSSKTKKVAKRIVAVKMMSSLRETVAGSGSSEDVEMIDASHDDEQGDILKHLSLLSCQKKSYTRSKNKTRDYFMRTIFKTDFELAEKLAGHSGQYFQELLSFARKIDENHPLMYLPHSLYKDWFMTTQMNIFGFYGVLKTELQFRDNWTLLEDCRSTIKKIMTMVEVTIPGVNPQPFHMGIDIDVGKAKEKAMLDCLAYLAKVTVCHGGQSKK